jgi:hypothetical protein
MAGADPALIPNAMCSSSRKQRAADHRGSADQVDVGAQTVRSYSMQCTYF